MIRFVNLPPTGGASRQGAFFRIVPLEPDYKAGLAGHIPANLSEGTPPRSNRTRD